MLFQTTLPLRFWSKVLVCENGCWKWTSCIDAYGYAQVWMAGKARRAHRVAYLALIGLVPEGRILDHLCNKKSCVNPFHLKPTTHRENILRGSGLAAQNVRKTHCPRGHPLSGANLYRNPTTGYRCCRKCVSEQHRTRWQERRLR